MPTDISETNAPKPMVWIVFCATQSGVGRFQGAFSSEKAARAGLRILVRKYPDVDAASFYIAGYKVED